MSIAVWNTSLCILTCFQSFWEVSTIQNWMPIGLRLLIAFGLFTLLGWWFALWFLCLSSLPWCFSLQCYWQLDQVESCLAYLAKHGGILQHFLVFCILPSKLFWLKSLKPCLKSTSEQLRIGSISALFRKVRRRLPCFKNNEEKEEESEPPLVQRLEHMLPCIPSRVESIVEKSRARFVFCVLHSSDILTLFCWHLLTVFQSFSSQGWSLSSLDCILP